MGYDLLRITLHAIREKMCHFFSHRSTRLKCKLNTVGVSQGFQASQGDLLGEVASLYQGAHSAIAVAVDPAILLAVPAERLERIVRTNPELAIALIRQLAGMAAREVDSAGHG